MPIRKPKRLPKRFQRRTSAISRNVARKHSRKKERGSITVHMNKLNRQWRRIGRSFQGAMKNFRIWFTCLVGVVIVVISLYFMFSPLFSVSSVRVSRQDQRVDVEEIQKLLQPFFSKHILFVSPIRLSHEIQSAYPEVSSVKVNKNYPNEIHVVLFMDPIIADVLIGEPGDTEAQAEELQKAEEEEGGLHRYITEKGVYLEYPFKLPKKPEEERLSIYLVDWAVKPEHRQKLFSESALHEVKSVRRILLESFGHTTKFTTFYLRSREFHVKTENNVLWFDLSNPVIQQINRYREFLRTFTQDTAKEYIDLRLHDRVVYR
jgi:hypothetical protein